MKSLLNLTASPSAPWIPWAPRAPVAPGRPVVIKSKFQMFSLCSKNSNKISLSYSSYIKIYQYFNNDCFILSMRNEKWYCSWCRYNQCWTFQACTRTIITEITELISDIWLRNEVPSEWSTTVQVPIPKKARAKTIFDFGRITLCSVAYKIYSMFLLTNCLLKRRSKTIYEWLRSKE